MAVLELVVGNMLENVMMQTLLNMYQFDQIIKMHAGHFLSV